MRLSIYQGFRGNIGHNQYFFEPSDPHAQKVVAIILNKKTTMFDEVFELAQCSRLLHIVLCRSNVQHVVAADQNLEDNGVI